MAWGKRQRKLERAYFEQSFPNRLKNRNRSHKVKRAYYHISCARTGATRKYSFEFLITKCDE
jgi:hypothetical protein